MVIERNGSVEIGERYPKPHRYVPERLLRDITVSIVKGVEQREQRCWLVTPALNQLSVRWG
jgi:hypothetical protein